MSIWLYRLVSLLRLVCIYAVCVTGTAWTETMDSVYAINVSNSNLAILTNTITLDAINKSLFRLVKNNTHVLVFTVNLFHHEMIQ